MLHACLKHERRRHVLYRLKKTRRPQALADLAEYVAGREQEATGSTIDRDAVKDVYLDLYHCHVPKLTEADLVEYEQDADVVALVEYPAEQIDEQAIADG